jgi:sRNA-binding protein
MKNPTAPGSGRQGLANSNNTNSSIAAPPPRQELTAPPAGRDGQELIAVLAGLFPAAFTAERWQPHRPLKIGIHQDLVDRGVLLPNECRVLRWYVLRRMYQVALAAGGSRYDLDGNVAGDVSPEQIEGAKANVALIEAKHALQAKVIADERTATRKTAKTPVLTKLFTAGQPATTAPSAKPAKLGLAELKAAARTRRIGTEMAS